MSTPEKDPQLAEKDFIHEGYSKNPLPLWLWLFLATATLGLIWGMANWYTGKINLVLKDSPFLQVTNRDLSLFLWQNPEFMRVNAKEKGNYLPGFQYQDKVTLDLAYADQYAAAPPEVIFRYHTWNRLLKKEFVERPIKLKDFRDFLSYADEWHPNYWPDAPKGYVDFIKNLPESKIEDLSTLSYQEFPLDVRMAFQGWQNYFIDGEAINTISVTYQQLNEFLSNHPNYARNYWQNIVPSYLKSANGEGAVPPDEMAPFLRVALFNYLKAK